MRTRHNKAHRIGARHVLLSRALFVTTATLLLLSHWTNVSALKVGDEAAVPVVGAQWDGTTTLRIGVANTALTNSTVLRFSNYLVGVHPTWRVRLIYHDVYALLDVVRALVEASKVEGEIGYIPDTPELPDVLMLYSGNAVGLYDLGFLEPLNPLFDRLYLEWGGVSLSDQIPTSLWYELWLNDGNWIGTPFIIDVRPLAANRGVHGRCGVALPPPLGPTGPNPKGDAMCFPEFILRNEQLAACASRNPNDPVYVANECTITTLIVSLFQDCGGPLLENDGVTCGWRRPEALACAVPLLERLAAATGDVGVRQWYHADAESIVAYLNTPLEDWPATRGLRLPNLTCSVPSGAPGGFASLTSAGTSANITSVYSPGAYSPQQMWGWGVNAQVPDTQKALAFEAVKTMNDFWTNTNISDALASVFTAMNRAPVLSGPASWPRFDAIRAASAVRTHETVRGRTPFHPLRPTGNSNRYESYGAIIRLWADYHGRGLPMLQSVLRQATLVEYLAQKGCTKKHFATSLVCNIRGRTVTHELKFPAVDATFIDVECTLDSAAVRTYRASVASAEAAWGGTVEEVGTPADVYLAKFVPAAPGGITEYPITIVPVNDSNAHSEACIALDTSPQDGDTLHWDVAGRATYPVAGALCMLLTAATSLFLSEHALSSVARVKRASTSCKQKCEAWSRSIAAGVVAGAGVWTYYMLVVASVSLSTTDIRGATPHGLDTGYTPAGLFGMLALLVSLFGVAFGIAMGLCGIQESVAPYCARRRLFCCRTRTATADGEQTLATGTLNASSDELKNGGAGSSDGDGGSSGGSMVKSSARQNGSAVAAKPGGWEDAATVSSPPQHYNHLLTTTEHKKNQPIAQPPVSPSVRGSAQVYALPGEISSGGGFAATRNADAAEMRVDVRNSSPKSHTRALTVAVAARNPAEKQEGAPSPSSRAFTLGGDSRNAVSPPHTPVRTSALHAGDTAVSAFTTIELAGKNETTDNKSYVSDLGNVGEAKQKSLPVGVKTRSAISYAHQHGQALMDNNKKKKSNHNKRVCGCASKKRHGRCGGWVSSWCRHAAKTLRRIFVVPIDLYIGATIATAALMTCALVSLQLVLDAPSATISQLDTGALVAAIVVEWVFMLAVLGGYFSPRTFKIHRLVLAPLFCIFVILPHAVILSTLRFAFSISEDAGLLVASTADGEGEASLFSLSTGWTDQLVVATTIAVSGCLFIAGMGYNLVASKLTLTGVQALTTRLQSELTVAQQAADSQKRYAAILQQASSTGELIRARELAIGGGGGIGGGGLGSPSSTTHLLAAAASEREYVALLGEDTNNAEGQSSEQVSRLMAAFAHSTVSNAWTTGGGGNGGASGHTASTKVNEPPPIEELLMSPVTSPLLTQLAVAAHSQENIAFLHVLYAYRKAHQRHADLVREATHLRAEYDRLVSDAPDAIVVAAAAIKWETIKDKDDEDERQPQQQQLQQQIGKDLPATFALVRARARCEAADREVASALRAARSLLMEIANDYLVPDGPLTLNVSGSVRLFLSARLRDASMDPVIVGTQVFEEVDKEVCRMVRENVYRVASQLNEDLRRTHHVPSQLQRVARLLRAYQWNQRLALQQAATDKFSAPTIV